MSSKNWSPKIARAMHEFGEAAPLPPSLDDVRSRPLPAPQRRAALPIAAAALVIVGIVGTLAVLSRDTNVPSGGSTVKVYHSRFEVTWEAQLECERPIENPTSIQSMVVDTWSDREGRQWRSQVTYPDGSTVDSILQGSAFYPSAEFERGEYITTPLGCVGPNEEPFVLVAGPDLFYTLTSQAEAAPDEQPYVPYMYSFRQAGTLIDPDTVDSMGRPSQRWEDRTSDGTAGYNDDEQHPATQVWTWWVDAADGITVTQRTFTSDVDTLGIGTVTETLLLEETVVVSDSIFDTDGYRSLGGTPRPDLPERGPDTTVTAAPSVFDNGASMIVWVAPGANPEQVELIRSEILRAGIVEPQGLRYLDGPSSLAEARRVLPDDPGRDLLNESNIPTMFQLFPTDPSSFDADRWRASLAGLPNVLQVSTPTDAQNGIPSPEPESQSAPVTTLLADCVGDDIDLSAEPPLWRQPEYQEWYRDGCLVRVDVITDRPGDDHCGWGSARVIIFGEPLGTSFDGGTTKQYVRDPADAFGMGLDVGYDADAELPSAAVPTGYSTNNEELWRVPGDDEFIYLVLSDRVERWPQGQSPVCN